MHALTDNDLLSLVTASCAELASRISVSSLSAKMVSSSRDIYELFSDLMWEPQETVGVAFTTNQLRVIRKEIVFRGTVSEAPARPREIFHRALKWNAAHLVVAHNHPSQQPEPSEEDILFTRELSRASKLMGIPIVDHLIVCKGGYFSFRDSGYLN